MDQDVPKVHDGDRVREIAEKSTLQVEGFTREMGWNKSKRYRMFRLQSWKASDLMQAGNVLGYDFLQVYRVGLQEARKATTTILVPVTVAFPGEMELKGFGDLGQALSPFPPGE